MKNGRLQVMPETLLKRDSEIFAIFIRTYLYSPIKINVFSGKVTKFPRGRFIAFECQKQSFADVLQNRRSLKLHKCNRKTPVIEPLFEEVTSLFKPVILQSKSTV